MEASKSDVEQANEAEDAKIRAVLRERERAAYAEQAVIGIAVVNGFAWRVDSNTLIRVYPYVEEDRDVLPGLNKAVTQYAVEALASLAMEHGFAMVEGMLKGGFNWSISKPVPHRL